jgi:hypothetical protein
MEEGAELTLGAPLKGVVGAALGSSLNAALG